MKRFLILCLSILPLLCQGKSLTVSPGSHAEYRLPGIDHPFALLLVRARLDLPSGSEAWGGYYLEMHWTGGALPDPINTPGELTDLCRLPLQKQNLYSVEQQRWFVRADSDYIAFNAKGAGAPYQREKFLGEANSVSDVSGYRNAYYDKVFMLPPEADETLLMLRNHSPDYPLHLEVEFWQGERKDCLFFVPRPGRLITRTAFPDLAELTAACHWRASPGERQALLLGARSLQSAQVFSWKLDPWRNATGHILPEEAFDVRFLAYRELPEGKIPREYLHYSQKKGTVSELPDRLVIGKEWQIPAGESSLMWIIARVPASAVPGLYRSQLHLAPDLILPMELEILPVKLAESPRIYGLWTNSLPGRDPEARKRQCQDLREHGINSFFLDPWTVPVPLKGDGTPDLRRFKEALQWLDHEKLNRKVLIYGILGPILQAMEKQAGAAEPENTDWCNLAAKIFLPMQEAAEKAGFQLYFHPFDEPDVHPKITVSFGKLCQALRSVSGLKIASNVSASGQKHFAGLLDLNICNSGYAALASPVAFPNPFFAHWPAPEPEWIREHVRYVYTQVRAAAGQQARVQYGLASDAANLKGVWGFAYHWGTHDWNIAWPFPEEDGRCGTTFGWEMLSQGIHDTRYWLTLKQLRPELKLPDPANMLKISAEELAFWRDEFIMAILQDAYNPQMKIENPPDLPFAPDIQVTAPVSLEGLEQIPVAGYRVYPGSLYKHYWNTMDRDWTNSQNHGQRLGGLCDATLIPANTSNVCYSFWRCQPGESYITVILELLEASDVAAVTVEGSNLSSMYKVSHAELSGSLDGIVFDSPGPACAPPDQAKTAMTWDITLPGCGKARFLQVSTWTGPNNYLNLRKIKVYQNPVSVEGENR